MKVEFPIELCQSLPTESFWLREDGGPETLSCETVDGLQFSLSADSKLRGELLGKVRGGEMVELLITAITFAQLNGVPNRKYVRIKESALAKLARSLKGVPFLRNHDQWDIGARAGTVVSSKLIDIKGGKAFEMVLRVTAQWAVEAVLAGNIDRFSIGWWRGGDLESITCSACQSPIGKGCYHYPGQKLDDGVLVEWIYTKPEGVEVSAVNVPAVPKETGISEIKSALSQLAGSIAKSSESEPEDQSNMDISQIALSLGLAADADPATIKAAIEANQAKAKLASDQVAQLTADNTKTAAELAALSAQQKQAAVDKLIADNASKFPVQRDASGALAVSDLETKIRTLAASDIGAAEQILAAIAAPTPADQPIVSVAPSGEDKQRPVVSPALSAGLSQVGLSAEDFEKYNPRTGTQVKRHTF